MYCIVTVGSTEQRSLSSTSSQASPAAVMQLDSYTTFDWDAYLRETTSLAAPPEYYKQVYRITLAVCPCWICSVYCKSTYQNSSVVTYFLRTARLFNNIISISWINYCNFWVWYKHHVSRYSGIALCVECATITHMNLQGGNWTSASYVKSGISVALCSMHPMVR
jgi:hypothetical protein